ncbi:MAG: alpha/beta hydrolase-fold protein [Candidatus Marinimicrobia bacterium]|nr:alpha/beta hydrolase-fold protein [Candidatus Neomarinimicrobiota bacterium]
MNKQRLFSRSLLIILILGLSTSPSFGKIHHLKIPSVALTDSNRIIVTTPDNFDVNKESGYPFIAMLHGWSGDETQWEDDADLQSLSNRYNILLVLPDGGYDGWWLDTDLVPGRNYASHIQQEIKIWMVLHFNGSPKASQQGIMGLSMGGFGAFVQALEHPGDYAAAASLSGVMDITRHQDGWGLIDVLGSFSGNRDNWEAHNPLHLAQKPAPSHGPALLLICGDDDFAFPENQAMAHQMKSLGYSARFQVEEGAHTHTFWKAHVGEAIDFIVSNFQK